MCNALIELLPADSPVSDRPIRLTNATGSVVLEMTSQRAWLIQDGKRQHEMTLDKAHGVLACYFAEEGTV